MNDTVMMRRMRDTLSFTTSGNVGHDATHHHSPHTDMSVSHRASGSKWVEEDLSQRGRGAYLSL